MTNAHSESAINSSYVGTEEISLITLDSLVPNQLDLSKNIFLKIDTQGYEWWVLDGAARILPHTKGILCELSLVPLYEGQYLWKEVIERLANEGFMLWSLQPAFSDRRDGRTLQLDATFFRF
jgi:hypothetical protein